jgi:signal peptide peptidase SppA
MKHYGHIISAVYGSPWAILPSTLTAILDMLRFRADGGMLSQDEIEARLEAVGPRDRQPAQSAGNIAVIKVHGIIAPRAEMLAQTSAGGTGLDQLMHALRTAMADPEVGAALLDFDSPGGQVDGVPEAAAEIRAMRERKPIYAQANGMIASAAYWLASCCTEIIAPPSGMVGSIGVYGAHEDMSGYYEQKGIKTTLVSAGKYKTEGADIGPLSEEALAYRQSVVDDFYSMFTRDVGKGRGVSVGDVRSGYGEGRMLLAEKAKAAGMIDRIDTIGGTINRMVKMRPAAQVAAQGVTIVNSQTIEAGFVSVDDVRAAEGLPPLAGPIARHKTATSDGPWDGPANDALLPSEAGPLKASHAWVDSAGDSNVKASYRYIHHEVGADGTVGAANMTACSAGCGVMNGARGGTTIPAADKAGVHAHLAGHLADGGQVAPPLKSEADIERSAFEIAARQRRAARG